MDSARGLDAATSSEERRVRTEWRSRRVTGVRACALAIRGGVVRVQREAVGAVLHDHCGLGGDGRREGVSASNRIGTADGVVSEIRRRARGGGSGVRRSRGWRRLWLSSARLDCCSRRAGRRFVGGSAGRRLRGQNRDARGQAGYKEEMIDCSHWGLFLFAFLHQSFNYVALRAARGGI